MRIELTKMGQLLGQESGQKSGQESGKHASSACDSGNEVSDKLRDKLSGQQTKPRSECRLIKRQNRAIAPTAPYAHALLGVGVMRMASRLNNSQD